MQCDGCSFHLVLWNKKNFFGINVMMWWRKCHLFLYVRVILKIINYYAYMRRIACKRNTECVLFERFRFGALVSHLYALFRMWMLYDVFCAKNDLDRDQVSQISWIEWNWVNFSKSWLNLGSRILFLIENEKITSQKSIKPKQCLCLYYIPIKKCDVF
jgi:hypothetical protein